MIKKIFIFSFVCFLSGCHSSVEMKGFDKELWFKDLSGCQSLRVSQKAVLDLEKDNLLRLNQEEIILALGKPDRQELDSRNKKLFIYFLEPGPDCPNSQVNPLQMHVRFNALGTSFEVAYKNL
jgi:hypothetical protein